jgi:hypothetical protein
LPEAWVRVFPLSESEGSNKAVNRILPVIRGREFIGEPVRHGNPLRFQPNRRESISTDNAGGRSGDERTPDFEFQQKSENWAHIG